MWIEVPVSAGSGLRGYVTESGREHTASGPARNVGLFGRAVRTGRHARCTGRAGRPGQVILTGLTTSATRTSRVKQMKTPATT